MGKEVKLILGISYLRKLVIKIRYMLIVERFFIYFFLRFFFNLVYFFEF